MNEQTIISPSGERLVVISEADYAKLRESADDSEDRRAVDAFRHDLAHGEEELIPADIVDRILDGESRIKAWREYRGMSSTALAAGASITQAFLSQLERRKRSATIETMRNIAAALGVQVQDIVEPAAFLQIRELLRDKADGMTHAEIVAHLGRYSESHIRACLDWLKREGVVSDMDGRYVALGRRTA